MDCYFHMEQGMSFSFSIPIYRAEKENKYCHEFTYDSYVNSWHDI